MFLWASLGRGIDAMQVAEDMLAQGHLVAPGRVFSDAAEFNSFEASRPANPVEFRNRSIAPEIQAPRMEVPTV